MRRERKRFNRRNDWARIRKRWNRGRCSYCGSPFHSTKADYLTEEET